MSPEQPQQTSIGFTNPVLRELAYAAVSLEATLVLERQQHAASAEAWRGKVDCERVPAHAGDASV